MQLYFTNKMLFKTIINVAYIKLQVLEFKIKLTIKDNTKL